MRASAIAFEVGNFCFFNFFTFLDQSQQLNNRVIYFKKIIRNKKKLYGVRRLFTYQLSWNTRIWITRAALVFLFVHRRFYTLTTLELFLSPSNRSIEHVYGQCLNFFVDWTERYSLNFLPFLYLNQWLFFFVSFETLSNC